MMGLLDVFKKKPEPTDEERKANIRHYNLMAKEQRAENSFLKAKRHKEKLGGASGSGALAGLARAGGAMQAGLDAGFGGAPMGSGKRKRRGAEWEF